MYDDGGVSGGAVPALGGVKKRINFEGLIPLILFVIIAVAALNYFGIIDLPFLPSENKRAQVLVIGEPSLGERVVLDNLQYMLSYRTRSADTFSNASTEELSQYDLIILDQSNVADKSVSVALGEAIQRYVNKGGRLIVVLNSGIYQSVGFEGYVASDVIGWKATFGDIVPAECVAGHNGVPTCSESSEEMVIGRVWQQDYDHPIMMGIEVAPPIGGAPIAMRVLPVNSTEGARTIAYIKAENTPKNYSAILEKRNFSWSLPFGTVVYFNYDPGLTQGIFKNTIFYLT